MVYPDKQVEQRFDRVHQLLDSPEFQPDADRASPWQPKFAELIILADNLLLRAQHEGKRIDFYEGVGVHGKIQDITSLVSWLRAGLPSISANPQALAVNPRFNWYFNQGTGYFANGVFFTTEFEGDLAFFLDDQRIYLNRQIRRAITEAEAVLQGAPN